jgi:hypothetical protein
MKRSSSAQMIFLWTKLKIGCYHWKKVRDPFGIEFEEQTNLHEEGQGSKEDPTLSYSRRSQVDWGVVKGGVFDQVWFYLL